MPELTYRPLAPADAPAVARIVSHWSVVRQLGSWPWPMSPAFVESRCKPYAGGNGFVWAVCESDAQVGTLGITGAGLGYMFHPDVHGRGVGGQAVRDAISDAFASYDWPEIHATTWADNVRSARVLARLGFRHWRSGYEHAFARGLPTLAF